MIDNKTLLKEILITKYLVIELLNKQINYPPKMKDLIGMITKQVNGEIEDMELKDEQKCFNCLNFKESQVDICYTIVHHNICTLYGFNTTPHSYCKKGFSPKINNLFQDIGYVRRKGNNA